MSKRPPCYAIKAAIADPPAGRFAFVAQKTMYGGKHLGIGDRLFLFASETRGGAGLVARGILTESGPLPRTGAERQTARITVGGWVEARAVRPLGRAALRPFRQGGDATPQGELDFKLYRQATEKVVGLTAEAGAYLDGFFEPPGNGSAGPVE